MSLAWELLTKAAHSESQLTPSPSSLSDHDQRLHVCQHPDLDPNTLAVARWTYRRVDRRCLARSSGPGQHHARPGTGTSLSARSSDSQ
jgi:hypothetical protein